MQKTRNQKRWQTFITLVVLGLVALNSYLLFTESWPFAQVIQWQTDIFGELYTGIMIISVVIVLAVELIPLFILKWLLEKKLGEKLS